MKKLYVALMLALGFGVYAAQPVAAMDLFGSCTDPSCSVVKDNSLKQTSSGFKIKNIINLATYILGGLAVVMVVVGALRMVISNGDPAAVKAGRETILWAVIGIIVAALAYSIVNFIVNWAW